MCSILVHVLHNAAPFTVMTYNILAEKYSTRAAYPYCPSWALAWENRKEVILGTLKYYLPFVICLQEVSTHEHFSYFQPELKHIGYEGVHAAKSRAKTMNSQEAPSVDGCAIFFRTDRFTTYVTCTMYTLS